MQSLVVYVCGPVPQMLLKRVLHCAVQALNTPHMPTSSFVSHAACKQTPLHRSVYLLTAIRVTVRVPIAVPITTIPVQKKQTIQAFSTSDGVAPCCWACCPQTLCMALTSLCWHDFALPARRSATEAALAFLQVHVPVPAAPRTC